MWYVQRALYQEVGDDDGYQEVGDDNGYQEVGDDDGYQEVGDDNGYQEVGDDNGYQGIRGESAGWGDEELRERYEDEKEEESVRLVVCMHMRNANGVFAVQTAANHVHAAGHSTDTYLAAPLSPPTQPGTLTIARIWQRGSVTVVFVQENAELAAVCEELRG